jgi:hypothetical protein
MNCYEYEIIHTSENPILKNVDLSIVLAMKGTNRFVRDPFILNLAKTTIIQWNAGFKKCKKHSSIKKAPHDIIHAYETALNYSKNYDNVIIFEDDAIVMNKDLCIYKKIDKFIGNENFDKNGSVLTFGSVSKFKTYDNDFLKADLSLIALRVVHAVLYSNKSRTNFLAQINKDGYTSKDSDKDFITNLGNIFTYKYPLIVQTFPETENSDNWFSYLDPITKTIIKTILFFFIKLLGLHINTGGWHYIYFLFSDIGGIAINLIFLLIILLFYNKTNIKIFS